MMQCLPIADMDIYQWSDRLQQINGWLKFFPVHTGRIRNLRSTTFPKALDDNQPMRTLEQSMPPQWKAMLTGAGESGFFDSYPQMVSRLSLLQESEKITAALEKRNTRPKSHPNHQGDGNSDNTNGPRKRSPVHDRNRKKSRAKGHKKQRTGSSDATLCKHCGKVHVNAPDGCYTLPENKNKRPEWWKDMDTGKTGKSKFKHIKNAPAPPSSQEANVLISRSSFTKLVRKAQQSPKRKVIEEESSDEDSYCNYVSQETGFDYMNELRQSSSSNNFSSKSNSRYSLFPFHLPNKVENTSDKKHHN